MSEDDETPALAELSPDIRQMLATAARSILSRDDGLYCECGEPEVYGEGRYAGLACWKCERSNKAQEKKRLDAFRDAHDFELAERDIGAKLGWCWCTHPESHSVHHGVNRPRTYSWE